jgi:acyl-CoA thioester hydrolase
VNTEALQPYSGCIIGKAHYFALRVYIEDTDLGGVVYHANYNRYLERARSDALRALGIDQRAAIEQGLGVYAVSELQIHFVRPARLEDDLLVVSDMLKIGGASCVICQKILRSNELMAEATVTVAFVGPELRPKRQPADWVARFRSIQRADVAK